MATATATAVSTTMITTPPSMEPNNLITKSEERENLRNIIAQWNANRLDLFEISEPNEDLEFYGVMRFYFQDAGQKVATKCMRISSTASTADVINNLIEKFRPDIRMLSVPEYALYEIHENGEERKLADVEFPLLVQLNWHKDDREGRFLLRRMDEKTYLPGFTSDSGNIFNRKLSKREKKEKKKKEKKEKASASSLANNGMANSNNCNSNSNGGGGGGGGRKDSMKIAKDSLAEKLYTELPETSFTRSISNPEAVMRRRRQQKLEKKLQQFSQEGGADAGGTLRIFGESINQDVPYKTILLSTRDTASFAVKEILEKYGKDKEDPQQYCLVQVIVPYVNGDSGNPGVHQQDANGGSTSNPAQQQQQASATASQNDSNSTTNNNNNSGIREYILDDDDCPLIIERSHNKSRGVLTFHIRRRPPDYQPRRRKKKLGEQQQQHQQQQQPPQHPQQSQQQQQQSSSQLNSPTSTSSLNPSYETTFDADGKVETSSTMGTIGAIKSENNVVVVGQPPLLPQPSQQSSSTSSMMFNTGSLQRHQTMGSLARSSTSTLGSQMPANTLMDQNMSRGIGGPPAPTSSSQMINHHHPAQMIRKGDNILPAILEVGEDVEDLFLTTIIKRIDPNQVQFKLCITYSLYMVTRYRASTYFKPEITPEIRAELLIMFCIKYSKMIQQTITEHQKDQSSLAFWLANSSEILHFLKNDRHLSAFTFDSQDILAEAVQMAFKYLVTFQQNDLQEALSTFSQDIVDPTNGAMDKMTQNILKVLSNSMQLLRRFRVNAALTIQLFSQLFHFINMWLFNKVIGTPETNYCSMMFGMKLKQCLAQIELWAEKQGLELAAECHLSRIKQTAMFLQATKKSQDDLNSLVANFYKLNSIQLRALCERYQPMPDELSFTADNIQNMVRMARKTTDELILNDGREIRLEEESDLQLPFLLPEDGYSCDIVRSIPTGLQGFVQTLVQTGVCSLTIQPTASGYWTIYFINFQPDQQQQQLQQPPSNTIIPSHTSSTTSRMYQEYSENMKNSQRNSVTTNLSISDKNSISNVHHFASNNNTNNQHMNQQHHSLPKSLTQTMLAGKQQQQQPGPPPPSSSSTMLPGQMMTLGPNSAAYGTVRMMAEPEIQVIKLQKINNGIGLSIVAARGTNQSQLGIYIKSVVKGGAADMDGRLEAGDQLLKVDGQSLIGITQEKAAELMTQTGPVVTLEVAKQGALYHGLGGILSQQASASAAAASASMIAKNMTLRPRMVVPNANDYGSSMHHRFNSQYSPMLSPQHHPQAARVPGYNSLPLSLNYPYRNQMGQTIGPIGAGGGGGGPQQLPSMNYGAGAAAGAGGGNSVINNPNMRPESQLSYNSQTANNNNNQNNMSPSLVNNTTINNSNNNNNIVNGRHMNLSTASLPAVNQNHSPAAAHIFGNHAPLPSSHQHLHQHPHPHHPHHNLAGGPEERHYQNIQLYHINPTSSIHNPNPSGGNQISSQQQQQQQQQSSSVSNMMPRSRLSASQQPQQTSSSASLANGFRPSSYHGSSSIINSMIRNSNSGLGNISQINANGPPPPAPKPNRSMVLGQSGGGPSAGGPVSGQENMIQHNNHNHQNHNNNNNNMNPYQHQQPQPHPPQPQQPPPPAVNYRYGPKGSISSPLTTNNNIQTTTSTTGTDLKSTKKVSWDDNPASVLNHHVDSDNSEEIEDDEDDEDEGEEEANNNANGRREQEAEEQEGEEEEEEEEEEEDGEGEGKDGAGGGGGGGGGDEEAQEDRFSLQDIDDVLGSHGSNGEDWLNNYVSGSTPGVIGAQEVYNDPRKRIEAERFKSNRNQTNQDKLPEKLSFQEKMKMFAKKTSGGV